MGPAWSNFEAKILQKSFLEASWGLLGPLGVSYRRPGASRGRLTGVLGRLGCVLRRLGGVPAASWGVLGAACWPTWLPLGSQNGAKIDKKSKHKSMKIWMPLGIRFLKDFG